MSRALLPFILISSCVVCCPKALSDEKKSPAVPDLPTTLDVRLVDVDGKPVEGAYVSGFTDFTDKGIGNQESRIERRPIQRRRILRDEQN